MTDAELNELLRQAHTPERAPDYWDSFSYRVRAALPAAGQRETLPRPAEVRPRGGLRLTAALGLVAACLVLAVMVISRRVCPLSLTPQDLATANTYLRELEALFPNQVQAVVFEPSGPRLELADGAEVPAALPVYLRTVGPNGCRSFITFSGQQIRLNGERIEVLVDARGEVLLVGGDTAWTSGDPGGRFGSYRLAACCLEAGL